MIAKVQFALFFKTPLSETTDFFISIHAAIHDTFDGDPTLLPTPKEAPPEIPWAILRSKDGIRSANISRQRIDIFFDCMQTEGLSWESILRDFRGIYTAFESVELARFGCTVTFVERCDSPVEKIQENYFSKPFSSLSDELSFRVNEPCDIEGTRYNKVLNVGNGALMHNGVNSEAIIVSYDHNTNPSLDHIDNDNLNVVISLTEQVINERSAL